MPQRLKPFIKGVFTDGLKAVPFKTCLIGDSGRQFAYRMDI
jgi:hypothetical protein